MQRKIKDSMVYRRIGSVRWELLFFGILGMVLVSISIISDQANFLTYIENIESAHLFTHLQFIAFSLFVIYSVSFILLAFIRKRDRKEKRKKPLKNPFNLFIFMFAILGMIISFILLNLAIENTFKAILNDNSLLIEIEILHVPLFVMSLIQYFLLGLIALEII